MNRVAIISLLLFLIPYAPGAGMDVNPTTLGKCSLSDGYASQVVLDGDIAYVADTSGGLRIIDVSNPAKPALLGSCGTGGNTVGVAVGKNLSGGLPGRRYVYVADAVTGMNTIEVTDPANPKRVGGWSNGGTAMAIVAWGPYIFEALNTGVQRFNVDDPEHPYGNGTFFPAANVPTKKAIDMAGLDFSTAASIVAGSDRIYVGGKAFDPETLKAVTGPGYGGWLALSGSRMYSGTDYEFVVADVGDPEAPNFLGYWSGREFGILRSFAVEGNRLAAACSYQGGGNALVVYDTTNPTNVVAVGARLGAGAMAVRGNLAYMRSDGFEILDIARAPNPQRIGKFSRGLSDYRTSWTAPFGSLLAAVDFDPDSKAVLNVLDPADAGNIKAVGQLELPSAHWGYGGNTKIVMSGIIAYVLGGDSGLIYCIDLANPAHPQQIGVLTGPGQAPTDIALKGNRAYVVDYGFPPKTGGLRVLDISTPASPLPVGELSIVNTYSIALDQQYAFVGGQGGLHVVDLSNETNPKEVGLWSIPGISPSVVSVQLTNGYAFIATEYYGFRVLDITDRTNPVEVATYPTRAHAVALFGGYAYVTSDDGLLVFDIKDPRSPVYVGGNGLGSGTQVVAANNRIFVGSRDVTALNLFDPKAPTVRLHPARTRSGEFHVIASGIKGNAGNILRSSDLINWTPWKDVTFDSTTLDIMEDAPFGERAFMLFVSPQ
jgi:hypothetical protein